ncbi:MBL fold metallo-hydrolase [Hazenella coriacea]|uniref:Glyoxylase-like metal-dependent hydrolase (Beta-lactamase superfamily II) n=1 Tax=Hazenella coriacea TaxID=1179467 RepID=A0A4R3L3K5_9BACL|nr:MBL fold metallo-hydrolase [Hazenella coriacea]TCS93230.1 glyoxylase-like metal-dependent hydrolase (beta-lactamase superfamily II) [Hazenella coriacea]
MTESTLQRLTDRIFYLTPDAETDRPILAAICGEHQTLLIDAGNSPVHADLFQNECSKHEITNIHMGVLTHWHWDHSFGASRLNVLMIAHEITKKKLEELVSFTWADEDLDQRVKEGVESSFCAEMIKKEYGPNREISIVTPEITFPSKLEIDLGNIHCLVEHVGGDHSSDSSVIFVKEEKVLFLGDCLYPDLYAEQPRYTVDQVLSLLDKLESYDANIYVLSHELPLSKSQFQGYVQLLRLLCQLTTEKNGVEKDMVTALSVHLGRELGRIELEAIRCFVHGVNG